MLGNLYPSFRLVCVFVSYYPLLNQSFVVGRIAIRIRNRRAIAVSIARSLGSGVDGLSVGRSVVARGQSIGDSPGGLGVVL
jgi:hypothetical protein